MTRHMIMLRHHVLDGTTIPPQSWFGNPPDIKCPNGHIGSLRNHSIAADGTVTPSVVCHDPECGWHVWARLDGWPPKPHRPEWEGL